MLVKNPLKVIKTFPQLVSTFKFAESDRTELTNCEVVEGHLKDCDWSGKYHDSNEKGPLFGKFLAVSFHTKYDYCDDFAETFFMEFTEVNLNNMRGRLERIQMLNAPEIIITSLKDNIRLLEIALATK